MSEYTKCSCCGKTYLGAATSIYKIQYKKRMFRCCSYSCYRKLRKMQEEKQYQELDNFLGLNK